MKHTSNTYTNEKAFKSWMIAQFKPFGEPRFTNNTVNSYISALKSAAIAFDIEPILCIQTVEELDVVEQKIRENPNFEIFNKNRGNGALSAGLVAYREYLISRKEYCKENDIPQDYDEIIDHRNRETDEAVFLKNNEIADNFEYSDFGFTPEQIIYYGAPGTGKSFEVNKKLIEAYANQDEIDYHSARVIFHPDYTYGDFVGSIRPVKVESKPLTYDFIPGPFTELLLKSFKHPKERFFLVLEEINRGNAAAVFGDLFQLLDRNPTTGASSYRIKNADIANFLKKDISLIKLFANDNIWLPSNFSIICTMNTADQNVFVLDSAFKRRFAEEYTDIDFTKLTDDLKKSTEVFKGSKDLKSIFENTSLNFFVEKLAEKGELKRDWPTFAKIVNFIIDNINEESGSEQISEDKKLGPFFVTVKDLECRKSFINKVLHYLKQDVFKYVDFYFTESYQTIYAKYLKEDEDIFNVLKRQGE